MNPDDYVGEPFMSPRHELKQLYVLRTCCGEVVKCSFQPISYEVTECQSCGDNELKLYLVTYVRAEVDRVQHVDWVDLPHIGIEWQVIKQIDASKDDVYIIPTGYNFYEDGGDTLYGERV